MIYWNYSIDANVTPSNNIKRLLNVISFKSLEFISYDSLEGKGGPIDTYLVSEVSMTGPVNYVKSCLRESIDDLKKYLDLFVNSDESIETKLYELSMSALHIKEFFLQNTLHDPVLLDVNFTFNLNSNHPETINNTKPIPVRWDQCVFSDKAKMQIHKHQHLRHVYINLLDNYISLWIEKVSLAKVIEKQKNESFNTEKEIQLLEVWIGLKESGFIDFLNGDTNKLSEHRKHFFELFALTDRSFNLRNREIKKRKKPTGRFLLELANLLEEYHKENK